VTDPPPHLAHRWPVEALIRAAIDDVLVAELSGHQLRGALADSVVRVFGTFS
jgi:hypothetical protein